MRFPRKGLTSCLVFLFGVWLGLIAVQSRAATLRGTLELVSGLNLIGVPVDSGVTPDVGTLFSNMGTIDTLDELLRLNPDTDLFEQCAYDTGGNLIGAGCSAPVAPGESWLVKAVTPLSIDYAVDLECPTINLRQGFNLVALPCATSSLTSYKLLEVLGDATAVGSIQALDSDTARWLTTAYVEGLPAGLEFPILRDLGYVVGMRQALTLSSPVAEAGPDRSVVVGATVLLDGSGSHDADNDLLNFEWKLSQRPQGSNAVLSDAHVENPSFIADVLGTYVIELVVTDAIMASDPDLVSIEVSPPLPPEILGFDPQTAPVGTLITLTGNNLDQGPGARPQITLNKQDGGTIAAPVASSDANRVSFTIPTGAATGPVTVTVAGQSDISGDELTIVASSDFMLAVGPDSANLIQEQTTTFAVTLNSTSGFAQLAALSVSGLPSGINGTFNPAQIGVGQTAIFTLEAPNDQSTGSANLTISAAATVEGIELKESVDVVLNVKPVTTTFMGRTVVDNALQTPLGGVTVTLLGRDGDGNPTGCTGQTISDAAGNFAFTNLGAECTGEQLIRYDGLTVTGLPGQYAGVDLRYNIIEGEVTESPVLIHLPRIDDAETVMVRQNWPENQTFTFSTIPNLEVTVYAGTVFTMVDGSQPDPFPLIAVDVPVDRLPDEMPPSANTVEPFIVAFQPANAEASQPVAVSFPNLLNTPPGTNLELSTLDPTKGVMVVYGTGTVTTDGTKIVPDFNPATPGRRYGLVHFDWHGVITFPGGNTSNPCNTCPCPTGGNQVDASSGVMVINETDIAVNGPRGSLSIQRIVRTLSTLAGPFGVGTNHNYGYQLDTNNPLGQAVINLVMPDGNRFPFMADAAGNFVNETVPSLRGAVMTVAANGESDLRFKDGTVFHFVPSTVTLGSILQSITDANGNQTTLVRNSTSPVQITEVIDPVGRKLILRYDTSNRITSITDPIGRTVSYSYNPQGRLETVTNSAGGVTQYNYDAQNRLIQFKDERGVVIAQNTYDDNGRVIEQTLADGGIFTFDYKLLNPLIANSPVSETTVTDPLGNRTTYRFNPQGNLIDVTDPLGQTRIYGREPGSNLLLSIDGAAKCDVCGDTGTGDLSFTYDANGNILTRTDALGNTTTFTYESVFNKVTSVTDPLGHVTTSTYDATGNLRTNTDENGNTTSFTYNEFGQVTESTDPLGHKTTFSYDAFGNLVSVTDTLGSTTTHQYDAASRRIATIDAMGRKTMMTYDDLDRVVAVTDPRGNTTQEVYDEVGNRLSVTDARGNTIFITYDPMNRLETRTDSRGNADTRTYDFNGNLIQFVDRRGQMSTLDYDKLNRLVDEAYQDGSMVTRRYDQQGRLIEAVDSSDGTFSFTYDPVGRVLSAIGPIGTVDYTRDGLGRFTQRQVVGQSPVDYTYDPVGNLLSAGTPSASVNHSYDAANRLVNQSRPNGVTTDYTYDSASRLLSLTHSNSSGMLEEQTYTYDAIGNRIQKTSTTAQPLTTLPSVNSYAGDSNFLLQRDAVTYTHDDNGNRLTETGPDATRTYHWDARNRLQSIETPSDVTVFRYDYAGNLIGKDTGVPGPTEPTIVQSEQYVLDEFTNVVFSSESGSVQSSILTGQSIDQHLAIEQTTGQVEYGLVDAINSTILTVDVTGVPVGGFQYEPFGRTNSQGSSYPFQFTGRVNLGNDLLHYRARYYDSAIRRFISEEPTHVKGGVNLYEYAFNDPINNLDSRGLNATRPNCRSVCIGACIATPGKPPGICGFLCRAVCSSQDCVTVSRPAGNSCTTFVTACPDFQGGTDISVDTLCCGI